MPRRSTSAPSPSWARPSTGIKAWFRKAGTGFRKKSCSNKNSEREEDLVQIVPLSGRDPQFRFEIATEKPQVSQNSPNLWGYFCMF
jgi:hypothetical protein